MAFTYRPKNKLEILKKNKLYSKQVSEVFDHIKTKYNESIILDPGSSFKNIKIPRIIQDSDSIVTIKNNLKKKIKISGLNIEFGNGSGTGGSNINAKETAQQENATRMVCEYYFIYKKIPSLKKIYEIYPKCDDEWYETFCKQAKAIKSKLGSGSYEFSRDTGIMPYVEDTALNFCGVTKKDAWNPADIYAVKKSKVTEIKSKLLEIRNAKCDKLVKLDMLNEAMRNWFKPTKRDLVGISLKKIKKNKIATTEDTNSDDMSSVYINDISISENINCNLDLDSNGEFKTGEMMFKLNVSGKSVTVQIRAFSGKKRENTQLDMTEQGAAAKLGKSSILFAIDPFLVGKRHTRPQAKDIPAVGGWSDVLIKKYIDEYNSVKNLKIGGKTINWGSEDWGETLKKAIENEKVNNRTASQLCAKLQCFGWVKVFNQFNKTDLKKFLTVLYYGAKKQYAIAGPFLKVS